MEEKTNQNENEVISNYFYCDDDFKACDKDEATMCIVRDIDKDGIVIEERYCILKPKQKKDNIEDIFDINNNTKVNKQ